MVCLGQEVHAVGLGRHCRAGLNAMGHVEDDAVDAVLPLDALLLDRVKTVVRHCNNSGAHELADGLFHSLPWG